MEVYMFISKSMRIFVLSILLVPVASQAVWPANRTMIAAGAYFGACFAAAFTPLSALLSYPSNGDAFVKRYAVFGAVGALCGSLIGYLKYKTAIRSNNEIAAKTKQEIAGKKAAEHAAGYAQIRNAQKAQEASAKAAKQAQARREYNACNPSVEYTPWVKAANTSYNAASESRFYIK